MFNARKVLTLKASCFITSYDSTKCLVPTCVAIQLSSEVVCKKEWVTGYSIASVGLHIETHVKKHGNIFDTVFEQLIK
jgi:hypothetical protein